MATVDPGMDGLRTNFGAGWSFDVVVPPGHFVRMRFGFNAVWSNVVWVYDAESKELFESRDNNGHGNEFDSPVNVSGRPLVYGIVGWHKTVSWTVDHPERFPWRQSQMKVLEQIPARPGVSAQDTVGFNDEGGDRWDNAFAVVTYIFGR
jgi:hypothetical protein